MDTQLQQLYAAQMKIGHVGLKGQENLAKNQVLIVGLGGLGCPVALYLATSGVGTLHLVDFDVVELSNLQRQILYSHADIGMLKTEAAVKRLAQIAPHVEIVQHALSADEDMFASFVDSIDVIVDCSDNFPTRYLLNRISQRYKIALVSGAAISGSGQIMVADPNIAESPCYACLYPPENTVPEGVDCRQDGVLAPVVGIIGTMQSMLVLQSLLGQPLPVGQTWQYDGMSHQWLSPKLKKRVDCPVCS